MITRPFAKLFAALSVILFSTAISAAPISFTDMPSTAGPGLKHNNFHDATLASGADGFILAWFDMGVGGGSYDPVTGDFIVNIDLYTDEALTSAIGTALGMGILNPAAFNVGDGGLIGSISWNFDATAEANGLFDATTSFYDVFYTTSAFGPANSANINGSMAMWGANGDLDPITGLYVSGVRPTLGVDFVATFVPVPAAAWLFGSGLLALAGFSKRRIS